MDNVQPMTMDPNLARQKYRSYRAELKQEHRERWKVQDHALKAAYRQMSRGRAVLDLVGAFRSTGLGADHLPKLAIARADVPSVYVDVSGGGATFWSLVEGRERHKNPRIAIPPDTWERRHWMSGTAQAPFMPPAVRPATTQLEKFWILWEARWDAMPPVDPLLLRPLGWNLWVVIAEWDLTDIERAVMAGALRG